MSIETSGKSIEEATAKAAKELGVDASALTVTVLEESKGLFGKANIRVQASVKEAPAPKATKARAAKPKPEPVTEVAPVEVSAEPTPAAPAKKGLFGKAKAAAPVAAEPAPAPKEAPAKPERRPRREAAAPAAEAKSEPKSEGDARSDYVATQEDGEEVLKLLRGLLGTANLDVTIELASVSGRYVNVTLDGADVAYLVGKHGEVLNNLQYLSNIIIAQKLKRSARVSLDGNQYRQRREAALTRLATGIADQVRERGEEAVLDALPAFERRIVHKVLSEMEGVHTYSEGEEPNRRVVIAPAE